MHNEQYRRQKNKGESKKTKDKFSLSIFRFLLFTFCSLLVLGCTESLQTITEPSDIAFVDELMPEAVRIIQEGLANDDPQIRVKSIEVVAATQRVELMPVVHRLLQDDFVPVRFAAALAVGDTEYRLAKSSVKRLLRAPDENSRIAAAYAMAKLGSPDSLGLIRKAIVSDDQTVRANAALLLGKSGDKNELKLLYWAMKDYDSDDKVRFQAAEAIARLGDEQIIRTLWTMIISAYADDRVIGIRAVGALGTSKAKDILFTKLDDDILEVRLAAAEQLGMLGDTAGEPVVLDVFTKNLASGLDEKNRELVNVRTALAIGRIGTAALRKFLPQLLKDRSKSVRIAAAKAVFQCAMKNRPANNR